MDERAYTVATALGWVAWIESDAGVRQATLPADEREALRARLGVDALADGGGRPVGRALVSFYAGEPVELLAVPLDLGVQSEFQAAVRAVVRHITPGVTRTYGEVAAAAGNPGAARAVGQVMATNPVPPFVPCHRVIARGGPGGFGGGLALKQAMLALES